MAVLHVGERERYDEACRRRKTKSRKAEPDIEIYLVRTMIPYGRSSNLHQSFADHYPDLIKHQWSSTLSLRNIFGALPLSLQGSMHFQSPEL